MTLPFPKGTHRCHGVVGFPILRLVVDLDVRLGVLELDLVENAAARDLVAPLDGTTPVARHPFYPRNTDQLRASERIR